MILTTLVAMGVAFPSVAIFMPFVLSIVLILAFLTIIVAATQLLLGENRTAVIASTRKILWNLSGLALAAALYLAYALVVYVVLPSGAKG